MAKWGEINCPRCAELEAENATLKQMWWDAGDVTDLAGTIAELEAKLRKSVLQELSALGQASEAYQAQLAAEARLTRALRALERIDLSIDTREQGAIAMATLAELKGQGDE